MIQATFCHAAPGTCGVLSTTGFTRHSATAAQRALPAIEGILLQGLPIISEVLSVAGRGRELFELMCANDLEGIVAKRLANPYDSSCILPGSRRVSANWRRRRSSPATQVR